MCPQPNSDRRDEVDLSDDPLEELSPTTPEFEEMLQERRELIRAIGCWRASNEGEAPDRVAELTALPAELEEEIQSKYESTQPKSSSKKGE